MRYLTAVICLAVATSLFAGPVAIWHQDNSEGMSFTLEGLMQRGADPLVGTAPGGEFTSPSGLWSLSIYDSAVWEDGTTTDGKPVFAYDANAEGRFNGPHGFQFNLAPWGEIFWELPAGSGEGFYSYDLPGDPDIGYFSFELVEAGDMSDMNTWSYRFSADVTAPPRQVPDAAGAGFLTVFGLGTITALRRMRDGKHC